MRMASWVTLVAALSLVMSSAVRADTYEYPEGDPIFTIDFPDGWKVECSGANMHAMPADESLYLGVIPVEAESLDAAADDLDEVISSIVNLDQVGEAEVVDINGLSFVIVEGSGTAVEDGTPISVATAIFSAGDSFIIMPYFGNPDNESNYQDDLVSILRSIQVTE